ncbi:hypothetical protein CBS101457_004061 [Exobasidium rhododendri]|nr:hypothetical protein CBS101457_004061 [Exobasidium rhododendri]
MPTGVDINVKPLLASIGYLLVCLLTSEVINREVEQPYLDEIFHVPQAQRYCDGRFEHYDPKLTTPPGLYFISLFFAKVLEYAMKIVPSAADAIGSKTVCTTLPHLRFTCLLALLSLPWVLSTYKHQSKSYQRKSLGSDQVRIRSVITPTSPMEAITVATANPSKSAQIARTSVAIRRNQAYSRRQGRGYAFIGNTLNSFHLTAEVHTISMLPPLWFFGFLYYTDVPSTVIVMAMLSASKRNKSILAALLGCVSLTLRQTNVIWILFAVGTSLLRRLSTLGLVDTPLSKSTTSQQLRSITRLPVRATLTNILQVAAPYIPVATLSGAFFYRNGRIVLGDEEHHQAALHWAQPLYCVAVLTIFAWPALISNLKDARLPRRQILSVPTFTLLTVVCLAAIHFGTIAHPFLLADNRHYTFYVWRKIINRTVWSRYALAPFYAIMLRVWWLSLGE